MNTRFQKIIIFLYLIIGFGCKDTIDLSPQKNQLEGIAIQGKLIKGSPSITYVNVERVFTYSGESRQTLPISSVSIFDETGNEFLLTRNKTVSDFIGYIEPNQSNFKVDYYQNYACRVVLMDGAIYESSFEMLLPVPQIENLEFEVVEKDIKNNIGDYEAAKFARFRVNTPIKIDTDAQKSNLRWIIFRTYRLGLSANLNNSNCVFTDGADFSHIDVAKGSRIEGDFLKRYNFYDEYITQNFGRTYYLTVQQESLTDGAFNYWNELKNLTQRVGTQFEPTPGVINSNFRNINNPSEEVYGYFYATSRDIKRIRICPNELGFQPEIAFAPDFCPSGRIPSFWEDCD